ncbi:MAG: lysophospholipid acyltransferase family protein [Nocardioidaceae bacterium]
MHDLTYRLVIAALRVAFAVLGLRIDVRGKEHIPVRGAAVIAANHNGYLDFAFVGLAATRRRTSGAFHGQGGHVRQPGLRAGDARHATHPGRPRAGAGAYRRALRLLRGGELVCVFPEGTISRSWMLKDFLPGAAALAIERGVPIVPVVTWGGHRVLTVDLRRTLRRSTAVTIMVGEPFVPPAGAGVRVVSRELRARMAVALGEAQETYPQHPRDDGDRWWLPAMLGGTAPEPVVAARLDAEALARSAVRAAAKAVKHIP